VDDHGFYKGGVPRQGMGRNRGGAEGSPGQFHAPDDHNLLMHDNPSITPPDRTQALNHKYFMNTRRRQFQRFKPYYMMDEVEQDTQYNVDSELRWLYNVPLTILATLLLMYWVNRYVSWKEFRYYDEDVKKLKPQDFEIKGMLLLKSGDSKFDQKYLNREEYFAWLDNDIRQFK